MAKNRGVQNCRYKKAYSDYSVWAALLGPSLSAGPMSTKTWVACVVGTAILLILAILAVWG